MKKRIGEITVISVVCLLLSWNLFAAVGVGAPATNLKLPKLFSDNMVMQRDMETKVWGWAEPGGTVAVSIAGRQSTATVNEDGTWSVELAPMMAGGPHTLKVAEKTFSNVMVGDVWICSGQSNMEWPVLVAGQEVDNAQAEVAAANHPNMRLFTVTKAASPTPLDDVESEGWKECGPETVGPFSAVGYFFGRHIREHVDVPIGLINSSWGGTPARAWTSESSLRSMPDFRDTLDSDIDMFSNVEQRQTQFEASLAQWIGAAREADAGYKNGFPVWSTRSLNTGGWATMETPGRWELAGLPDYDGVVWFRREIDLPAAWARRDLTLSLGPIDESDQAFVNGVEVGRTDGPGSRTKVRVYKIPGYLAKGGGSVITVRITDWSGRGGFMGQASQMTLAPAGDATAEPISLAGPWLYRVGTAPADLPTAPREIRTHHTPTVLFNGMINPLLPFAIRGAIWYQGETDAFRAHQYRELFPTMIEDWRSHWGQSYFPFIFVQLANFMDEKPEPADDEWAELREAQLMTLSLQKTGMAVTIDIGNAKDIHPRNKQDVGMRLGLAARAVAYGQDIVYSGPIYKSVDLIDDGEGRQALRLGFEHVGGGLVAKDGPLTGFAIAGEDKVFVWAEARIEGASVIVRSEHTTDPVAARYGWASNPVCNLYNKEGLPASPFRTDNWSGITVGKK
jgi:sialate O-acetylesterase